MGEVDEAMARIGVAELDGWEPSRFLEHVLKVVPSTIYIYNQKTQSNEYANRSVGFSLGYSAEEVKRMGAALLPTIVHPDDLPRISEHFAAIAKLPDGETIALEYRVRHKAGHWVWLLSHDTVFERDANGAVERHIGIAQDITMQKSAEEKAAAETRAAAAANEELRSFAYSISHDMKSPSYTLRMLLDEMESEFGQELGGTARELLGMARLTVRRMTSRVEDVLNYTRLIGKESVHEEVALGSVMDSILRDLHTEIAATEAKISVAALPDVWGDRSELCVLFQNLMENALKYHAAGQPPCIQVYDASTVEDSHHAITIEDRGIGIPEAAQERIFDMFERLHLEDEYPGTGLGLSICRRIALGHGGDIKVRSTPGQGAAFTVMLRRV